MPAPDRVIWEWIDDAGGFLRASNWCVRPAAIAGVDGQLQLNSNAALQMATAGTPLISSFTPIGVQYHLVTDLAQLLFATVPGTTIQVVVPGPLVTTFGPSSNVVNPLDPNVAALIASVVGVLTDNIGNPVTAYVSGVKSSRRTEQT